MEPARLGRVATAIVGGCTEPAEYATWAAAHLRSIPGVSPDVSPDAVPKRRRQATVAAGWWAWVLDQGFGVVA